MTVKPIVLLGDPTLRLKGEPVDSFGKYLHELLDDLTDTMRAAPGVGLAAPQDLVDGALQQPPALEPVVVVAEGVDAVLAGQRRLGRAGLGEAQIVEAQVRRQLGLLVAREARPRPGDVGPLGEALAPPLVVLGGGVVLGQVEGDRAGVAHRYRGRAGRNA